MRIGIPLRLRLPLLIELGDSKSHPADFTPIQGLAIRAIDLVGQGARGEAWNLVSKGQSKLFINKVVKLLGLCLASAWPLLGLCLAWAIGVGRG